ncbi:MAG: ABC transporter ATP-binding protein [Candidatus Omnitrophica bacterium]|nr:ABC transporter ATP-binding protein [Candidatus Omnitrophota bacterium]
MNAIEFNNVSKKFRKGERFNSLRDSIPNFFSNMIGKGHGRDELEKREFWAVNNVDFHIKKGEVVGIIGPNGAGKSTILKLLSGIIIPNKGTLAVNGRLSALIEVTAGFHPELTGRENIYLNGTILGMKKKEIDEKFEDIVDFSGIREFIDTPVKRYSSGMFSRLGFSVAAHVNPEVLLVDEVLAVGDIAFQSKCAEKMRELLDSGVTIILVSHNIALIRNLCQRVILLDKGQVLKGGIPGEVIPYYENLVHRQRKHEFQKKMTRQQMDRVKVDDEAVVEIKEVHIMDETRDEKESFSVGTHFIISVDFEAKEKIENPVFSLEVTRADGVVCCMSDTREDNFSIVQIDGQGTVEVDLGKLNLAPGIYGVNAAVWDEKMIHPFAIRHVDVFFVEAEASARPTNAVFLWPMGWTINKTSSQDER